MSANAEGQPGSALEEDGGQRADRAVAAQQSMLPPGWRSFDRVLLRCTGFVLFAVGTVFTVLVTAEVLSRYLLSFSLFFVNPGARLLLVWFFLLGAGMALRHNAHVGFELLVSRMHGRARRTALTTAYLCSLVFFLEMLWGGIYSIGPAIAQNEAGLGISIAWFVLAVPVGFAFLAYHMVVLLVVLWREPARIDVPAPAATTAS